jgi:hypothetical protein
MTQFAPTLAVLIERAEKTHRDARRAAAKARQRAEANPDDLDARFDREDADRAATDAGRKLADLRWDEAEKELVKRLQQISRPTQGAVDRGFMTAEERAAILRAGDETMEALFGRDLLALAPVGPYGFNGYRCRDASWLIGAKLARDGMKPPACWRSASGEPLPKFDTRANR